jgi:hypothetical protein
MIFFYYVKKGTLYNYADDNTLSYGHPDFNVHVPTSVLESESNALKWTYHRPKVYPIKYHGVGNQMPWKDPLGLRKHTDFF